VFEIKADYLIDDAVTAAREKYALEMGFIVLLMNFCIFVQKICSIDTPVYY
jgi:hypothetical protein